MRKRDSGVELIVLCLLVQRRQRRQQEVGQKALVQPAAAAAGPRPRRHERGQELRLHRRPRRAEHQQARPVPLRAPRPPVSVLLECVIARPRSQAESLPPPPTSASSQPTPKNSSLFCGTARLTRTSTGGSGSWFG